MAAALDGTVVTMEEVGRRPLPALRELAQHPFPTVIHEVEASTPQVRGVQANADATDDRSVDQLVQLRRRGAELAAGADITLEQQPRGVGAGALNRLDDRVSATRGRLASISVARRPRVQDNAGKAEPTRALELFDQGIDRAPPQLVVRACRIEQVWRVREGEAIEPSHRARSPEAFDLQSGERRRSPSTGRPQKQLQRLAASAHSGRDGAADATSRGQVRAKLRHGPVWYPHGGMKTRLLRWLMAALGMVIGCVLSVWIILWISLRSSAVKAPDLRGLEIGQATATLQESGLVARVQDQVFDPQIGVGRIARQRPPAGFELKRGASVLLYPSLGKEVQRVGELAELPLPLAEAEIENERLVLDRRCEVEGQADGVVVLAQSPPAGTMVAPGSAVTLLVNRAARPRRYIMPEFVGSNESDVTRILRETGFQLADIQSVPYPGAPPGMVLRQDPQSGGSVNHGAVVALWVSR